MTDGAPLIVVADKDRRRRCDRWRRDQPRRTSVSDEALVATSGVDRSKRRPCCVNFHLLQCFGADAVCAGGACMTPPRSAKNDDRHDDRHDDKNGDSIMKRMIA
jgi:hypothetical protein